MVSNISNAIFVIISAIGFGTAMGACHFLQQKSVLENDLWLVTLSWNILLYGTQVIYRQWACNKEHAGDTDPGKPPWFIVPELC
jgi:hypothetical protein